MGAPYPKTPVVLVFKTSNRSNARTKMKIFKTKEVKDLEKKIGTSRLKNPDTPQSSIIPYFPKIG